MISAEQTIPSLPTRTDTSDPFDDEHYEVVAGQRVESPRMGAFECWLATRLVLLIQRHCDAAALGRIVVETLFLIDRDKDLQRRPDVAFVSFQRWPKNQRVPRTNAWPVIPNLAVEVISASNTADEVVTKIREYFAAGCERVWVIYPTEESLYDYSSPTETRILTNADTLDGASLLPGFRLALRELFEE